MLNNIVKGLLVISEIFYVQCFLISKGGKIFQFNKNLRKSTNMLNLKARYCNNISRRNILYLSPVILNPKLVLADNDNLEINKIAVFGASGYTGGDTIRNLLNRNKEVIALTRREMKIVDREHMGKNTLVIDNINQKNKITNIVCDVMKPNTLNDILKNVDAVIYCAASKAKVKMDPLDPMLNKQKNIVSKDDYVEESNHVEDIGLKNVVNEVIKNNVKKLVIVSSICAKCQKNMKNEYENPGEVIDRGETTCEPCFNKQEGEELVKLMYEKHPELSYTIVRPGMLSPGEKRGVQEIEFNQGVTKSGIISREDLSEILIESALSKDSGSKTFEVYYKDTAQPVDMYKSLQKCKEMGKSVKECFFGEGYEKKEDFTIDKLLKNKVKGAIFPSGNEVIGTDYNKILKELKKDEKVNYDISILGSNDIL
jgi:nucleoside-diphosphate-sugar epimerase